MKDLLVAKTRPGAHIMTDVVIAGSDPGALVAAIACRLAGWEVLVIEPTQTLGGSVAHSPGYIWLPGREEVPVSGTPDSYAQARNYFDHVVVDHDEATSPARRHAFLMGAGQLRPWLEALGVRLIDAELADHYPDRPGGARSGRVLMPAMADATQIGRLAEFLPAGSVEEASFLERLTQGARQVVGENVVVGGAALVSELIAICQRLQVTIWWNAPITELLLVDGRAEGVVMKRSGRDVVVQAGFGIVLAQGGFGSDTKLRRELLPTPSREAWSLVGTQRAGAHHLQWASDFGFRTAGLSHAWWRPAIWDGAGQVWDATTALAAPHGFLVDATGARFCNEAAPGVDITRALFERARVSGPQALPAWLIFDSRHRSKVAIGDVRPGRVRPSALESGFIVKARTLPELAWKIKVDAASIEQVAERFDTFAETGVDSDYSRGHSAYGKSRGDKSNHPNPTLGAVSKPPFYAVRIVPSEYGTKGGLLVDEASSVLNEAGPVDNLWAIGSAAASVTGAQDPAPGVALAESLVAGRAVADAITRRAGLEQNPAQGS